MQPLGDMQVATQMFSYIHAEQKEDCAVQSKHNLQVAFALAAFRRDHARYPAMLNDLSPNYLKDVPADLFTGKPLIYRPEPNGYLLYSVGLNGKDDGGRVENRDTRDDDIAIVVPAVRPKRD